MQIKVNKNPAAPVGVFDSGIGGLTVARAISGLLPEEQLIYFGDTAHMPYGNKSPQLVSRYALRISGFLLSEMQCKAVVIACNTASAAAYTLLRNKYEGIAPVINVIDPMVEAVIADESVHKVGIIGTLTTIGSGVYTEKLARRKPSLKYAALATPLLASLIEEGYHHTGEIRSILKQYLSHPSFNEIDALILACTHYPIIKDEIAACFNRPVKIFDSALVVAQRLKEILAIEKLLAEKRTGNDVFYVSDLTDSFRQITKLFFNREADLILKKV
jgi:glutamate racemase